MTWQAGEAHSLVQACKSETDRDNSETGWAELFSLGSALYARAQILK